MNVDSSFGFESSHGPAIRSRPGGAHEPPFVPGEHVEDGQPQRAHRLRSTPVRLNGISSRRVVSVLVCGR